MADLNVAAYEVLEERRIEDISSMGYITRRAVRMCA